METFPLSSDFFQEVSHIVTASALLYKRLFPFVS